MGFIGRGKVRHGAIELAEPLPLPVGSDVVIHVEPATTTAPLPTNEFTALPFFGMWADRGDAVDSAEWVREGRERWHRRAARAD